MGLVVKRVGAVVGAMVLLVAAPAAATPGPADAPEYWFDSWQIPTLWAGGARGQGITIAEIDTGVTAGLPELSGRILPGADLGLGGTGHIDREKDEFGHGTAMASIMVARPGLLGITGIAPAARILPIAVPLNGTVDAGRPDKVPQAIRYAADHHAKIISMSLGGKRTPGVDAKPCNDAEQAAIYYALRKGTLVIASVGNTGPRKNTIEDPGVCLGVLSVGAVDETGTVASFSAREPYLTLVAPGVNIPTLSRVAGQAYSGDGTSQATAITSAVAALVWSRYPNLDARGVSTRILATLAGHRARPSTAYGYGLLDAYRAVTATVAADAPNPVYDAVAPFMSRVDALDLPPPSRPAAAPRRSGPPPGSFQVGSVSRLTTVPVLTGIATSAAGVLMLLLLFGFGIRARSRRQVAAAAAAAARLAEPPPAPAATSEVLWTAQPVQPHRPRPGPGGSDGGFAP
jgi:subtilisin family serine protease